MARIHVVLLVLLPLALLLASTCQVQGKSCLETVGPDLLQYENCVSLEGGYFLSWNLTQETELDAVFSARHDGWIAFGFSPEGGMVHSNVLVGSSDSSSEQRAKTQCYHLGSKDDSRITPPCESEFAPDRYITFYNGSHLVMHLKVQLDVRAQTPNRMMRIVYAKGDLTGSRIEEHKAGDGLPALFDFTGGAPAKVSKSHTDRLRRRHAILQFFAYGLLIPLGPILPRFFKSYDPFWFYAHAAIQGLGVLLGTIGFAIGITLGNKTRRSSHLHFSKTQGHYIIGIFVLTLSLLQVVGAVVRPKKDGKWRPWWNFFHHASGHVLILFAIINVYLGFNLYNVNRHYSLIYSIFIICLFIGSFVLEFNLRSRSREDGSASTIAIPSLPRVLSSSRGPTTSESTGRFERL